MSDIHSRGKAFYFIIIFLCMLIWGTSCIIMKDTLSAVPPGEMIFIRSLLTVLCLMPFSIGKLKKIPRAFWKLNLLTGLFVGLGYLSQAIGLQYTTPGKNAFLENVYCITVPLLIWFLQKKRPALLNFVSMAICFTGVTLMSLNQIGGRINWIGDGLSALAGVLYGVNIALTGTYVKDKDPMVYTACQFTVVSFLSGTYSLAFEQPVFRFSGDVLLKLLFLGVVVTALAWVLRNIAQQHLKPLTVSVVLPFSAVVSFLISLLLGQDKLTYNIAFGGILMLAAVILDACIPGHPAEKKTLP